MPQAARPGSALLLEITHTVATAITPSNGMFSIVATTIGAGIARQDAVERRRSCYERSRSLCEDLVEHLGWLGRPDDPDLVDDVVANVQADARALVEVLIERAALHHAGLPPCVADKRGAPPGLCAIVTALDAEIRLGEFGDPAAPERAFTLAGALVAGADTLAATEDD